MIESCDVGSLPFVGDIKKFLDVASVFWRVVNDSTRFFESKIVDGFVNKSEAGIDVSNYPQYRDMIQMFLDIIDGIGKVDGGYVETTELTVKEESGFIPEAYAIKNCSKEIYEKLGTPFNLRVCITGPYTLSSLFAYKDRNTFTRLGRALTQIAEKSVFTNKYGTVRLVAVDEPVLGFIDDPLLDRGSEARENLLKAWESMMQKIVSKGAQASLHLHNTREELFWEVQALDIIESHANDPLYQARRTKERLESTDKFLKASICTTDFDQLIRENIIATSEQRSNETSINEKIAETWRNVASKKIDPVALLEDVEIMKEHLVKMISYFGQNRVPYAGPECGLRGFPTYESAIECLRRVSKAVRIIST